MKRQTLEGLLESVTSGHAPLAARQLLARMHRQGRIGRRINPAVLKPGVVYETLNGRRYVVARDGSHRRVTPKKDDSQ